jgi:hypothetical protein
MSERPSGRLARLVRSRRTHVVAAGVAVIALSGLCLLASGTPATSSGYIARLTNSTDNVTVAPVTCTQAALLDKAATPAIFQWALNDGLLGVQVLGTSPDASGNNNVGNYQTAVNTFSGTTPLACPRDGGNALVFTGSNPGGTYLSSSKTTIATTSSNYSIEVWFKAATGATGKLIGLGSSPNSASSSYDRHLYIDSTGKLVFGSYTTATQTITTTAVVTDSKWHLAVGTQSNTAGMVLYLDGIQVAANQAFTAAQAYTGYWHVGYDNLTGWPNAPTDFYFTGQMRYAAAYAGVLTAQQAKSDYLAGS